MIGCFFTVAAILLTISLGVSKYVAFLLLTVILLLYRNSLGLKSIIFGYVFLFQKKLTRSALMNHFSALIFIIFYFSDDLNDLSFEMMFSIFSLYIVLYYWLFDGLPFSMKIWNDEKRK